CISSIVWLGASIYFSLAPFGTKTLCTNDGTQQYMPFLSEMWSIFHGEGSLLYSFHGGLGNNFYLTCVYYLLSPFTFLVLFFNKSQIPIAANLIVILKNILVITIMAWYLASKNEKPKPFLACSIAMAYGLSYYFLSYSFNFMWMDGIALVPLMLYGMERLNTRKGRLFYTLSLTLAILTNFYMGAIICIFLALYYVVLHLNFNTYEGWEDFKAFALCSICAALIGGIVLLPVAKVLVSENASKMKSPNIEFYNDAKYFFSRLLPTASIVKISKYNRGVINLYMGVGAVFGTLLFLFTKPRSKREKYGLLFLIALYLFSTQFSLLNYVFHGFYMQRGVPNRYAFVINLLIAIAIYECFSNLQQDAPKKIILAGVISTWYFGVMGAWDSSDSLWLALGLSFVALLYLGLTYYKKTYLLSLLILLESVYGLTMLSPNNLNSMIAKMESYMSAVESMDSTGRVEFIGKNIGNPQALYGVYGVTTFNSVLNSDTASFLGELGCDWSSVRYYFFSGWTSISALFLGVQDLISNDSNLIVPQPYSYKEEVDSLEIYQSPYD
ncbi:MAG: YfhO family protein, partial [Allobaculum sp.]|nr:YfhO family protein [Allobaculum sp.]